MVSCPSAGGPGGAGGGEVSPAALWGFVGDALPVVDVDVDVVVDVNKVSDRVLLFQAPLPLPLPPPLPPPPAQNGFEKFLPLGTTSSPLGTCPPEFAVKVEVGDPTPAGRARFGCETDLLTNSGLTTPKTIL